MIVLGIDTSAYANAVGLANGERVLAEADFPAATDSLEQIVDNIDLVLRGSGVTLAEVEGIGVGLGPGSWTGIRVGVTVGKMLAFATGKPVVGVPTLEALVFGVISRKGPVCAVIGAGTGNDVYAACYTADRDISRIGDYYTGHVTGLTGLLAGAGALVGTGAAKYRQEAGLKKIDIRTIEAAPSGLAVAMLAARRLEKGDSDDVLSLAPLYLKESTAKAMVRPRPSTGSG
jgi:tRNA threonylcarbamoyladenosine biosynthesis protein TsaB